MCEKKKTLKERLDAIMKHKERTRKALVSSMAMIVLAVITVGILGAGVIPALAEEDSPFRRMPSTSSKYIKVIREQPVDIDTAYLAELRKEGVRIRTAEEFMNSFQDASILIIEESMTIEDIIYYNKVNVLVIEEDVTLTIAATDFFVYNQIVNLGEIIVTDGRMRWINVPRDYFIGKVRISGHGDIVMYTNQLDLDLLASLLENPLFTTVEIGSMNNFDPPLEAFVIDRDFVIPVDKKLLIGGTYLHLMPGVVLTNYGRLELGNDPIIEGTIEGSMPLKNKYAKKR